MRKSTLPLLLSLLLGSVLAQAQTFQPEATHGTPEGTRLDSVAYVNWQRSDTLARSIFRYSISTASGDTVAYTAVETLKDHDGDIVQTRNSILYTNADVLRYERHAWVNEEGKVGAGYIEYWKEIPEAKLRSITSVPLEANSVKSPKYRVQFDSVVTASPTAYEVYTGSLAYADSLALPDAACFENANTRHTSFPSPDHQRTLTTDTYYSFCLPRYRTANFENSYFDNKGRILRRVDTIKGIPLDSVGSGPSLTSIQTTTYTYRGRTRTASTEFRTLGSGTVVKRKEVIVYDDQDRPLTVEQFGMSWHRPEYLLETRTSTTYALDREVSERVSFEVNGRVPGGTRFTYYFSPRTSGVKEAAFAKTCAQQPRRTVEGFAFSNEATGAHTAYDMTGRTVWQTRASASTTVTFAPGQPGVYILQGPDGCTSKVVW